MKLLILLIALIFNSNILNNSITPELLNAIKDCQLINTESFEILKQRIREKKITTVEEVFSNLQEYSYNELPEEAKKTLNSEEYFAVPLFTKHTVIPPRYSTLVQFLNKSNLISQKSEYDLLKYLKTPSSDLDTLIYLGTFNYTFIKLLQEHINP